MQRTFVAIAFALAMTCAFAGVNPSNYVKAPVQVIPDSETNFTNKTGGSLQLASLTTGNVYLVSNWRNETSSNESNYIWNAWFKKLNVKDFATTENLTLVWNQPASVAYINGYVIGLTVENDTGIPAIRAYQQPITGGTPIPRLTLSTNTNASWFPVPVGVATVGKNLYVFYLAADKKVNVTNFAVGGSVGTNEFTLTTAFQSDLQTAWGESISSNQVFAAWMEGDALKDTLVDLSKGTNTPVAVGAWNKNWTCSLYATDKKWYGELCVQADTTSKTFNYTIRTNSSSLVNFITTSINQTRIGAYPYGPYLAIFYRDSQTTSGTIAYSYDIWNLDTLTAFKNNTQFLTNDGKSAVSFFNVNAGGIYTLTYTPATSNTTITSVFVGLVLGGSYLTTIAGFLFAIVAGLFLF